MSSVSVIISVIIGGLLALCVSLGLFLAKSHEEIGIQKEKIAQYQVLIESQNEAIEKLAVDTNSYMCDLESINTAIRGRYAKIENATEDSSCEHKLKSIQDALHIFDTN